jgi:tRNA threonylcarbamoyl adenosine modification protein (Sua5/YciO/YrdC/YwlC family)
MLLKIFPDNINDRHIERVVQVLKKGGIIVLPTDTVYALACSIRSNDAIEKVCRIKKIKLSKANFSFICYDLANIADFTKPFNSAIFRLMKSNLPGPFTFILNANNNVPAIFKSNKKTIGIRVPDNKIAREIVNKLGNPLMVTSVHDDDESMDYLTDPLQIDAAIGEQVDLVIDGGYSDFVPSTVIDCTDDIPVVIREGKGKMPTTE